ncbi:MAG: ATP-grasp domain-containing protein [Marinobacter sp.]|nr:ATP-grasp domain-containing protein [Marinobacter sp.]
MSKIQRLLVANRGEIALRIMKTAQAMGIHCVAVYSEADAKAPFVAAADTAIAIGPAAPSESYLNVERILSVARQQQVDAVHPGYGFLSENTRFAEACEQADIRFIGPPASAIAAMGSKSAAKALMEQAGIPLVPGYHGDDQRLERFQAEAPRIGFPLLIKASAGGGGKGMRVVRQLSELDEAIAGAQREGLSSFGDDHLLMERYLEAPRHVEVQILFDRHGAGRYLFDRDCSVQRRHQKIIEEAPAPGLRDSTRQAMGEAAVRSGEAIGYVGAGTVEFLYDPATEDFFFMEMNTRLQVEHPVTELVTGLDLVEWQIKVAEGTPLPWQQSELTCRGHAMEARIYAEDPAQDFLPQTGVLHTLREPNTLPQVRVDTGVTEGQEITPWYDPMLAKVISWGENREQSRLRLMEALRRYHADGVTLNTGYVHDVLGHPAFAAAELTTGFVDNYAADLRAAAFTPLERKALSWLAWYLETALTGDDDPWGMADGFRLNGQREPQPCEVRLADSALSGRYTLAADQRSAHLQLGDDSLQLSWAATTDGAVTVELKGPRHHQVRLDWALRGARLAVFADASQWHAWVNHPELQAGAVTDDTELTAPMHGRVTALHCQPGDLVTAGQPLLVMEAMKMEHTLRAGADARVKAVHCEVNASVAAGQVVIELEPNDGTTT